MKKKKFIFWDGEIVGASASFLDALAPGRLKGKGVFETMRAYEGKVFGLEEHLRRMRRGLKVLGIRPPIAFPRIQQNVFRVLKANGIKNARMRVAVWRVGNKCHVAIVAYAYTPYSASRTRQGFKAKTFLFSPSPYEKKNRIKSIQYRAYLQVYQRAQRAGYDEAILIGKKKEVIEGSRTNVFCVQDGVLYTPSLQSGCLNGITRKIVLCLAKELGIPRKATAITLEDLRNADEVFVTNSVSEIMPVRFLDEKKLGAASCCEVTKRLIQEYQYLVNKKGRKSCFKLK